MKAVQKWYGDYHALKDVDFSVEQGERVVICGPSGSGKSTLIRCINGLETCDAGSIVVNGIELTQRAGSVAKIRSAVGMVFQQFNLFPHLSALENCTLALTEELGLTQSQADEKAMQYLSRVRIADQAAKRPAQLSGGQQQRVAIARALCLEPELMLFDEPTSALDPEMISEVLETMVSLAEDGMSMICVTHELGFAREVAHRIIFMDEGALVEARDPVGFFERPENPRTKKFLSKILR
ncbi:MAG TPA: glutamine ABC transporter ATP-binding protein [Gammaproteobacteria bacterium]|nr:glutamine ABC transporter ATP-binding protein [Gammaproteobacteria bacterium]